jgi:hypothetical protein
MHTRNLDNNLNVKSQIETAATLIHVPMLIEGKSIKFFKEVQCHDRKKTKRQKFKIELSLSFFSKYPVRLKVHRKILCCDCATEVSGKSTLAFHVT